MLAYLMRNNAGHGNLDFYVLDSVANCLSSASKRTSSLRHADSARLQLLANGVITFLNASP
jgi:hypothetical protein